MPVVSSLQLISLFILLIGADFINGEGHSNRDRRQLSNTNDRNQQDQTRSRGFYSSPDFKPPILNGAKPVGWFDTKYPNWISNRQTEVGQNSAPSSLQADGILARREDGGSHFMQKMAQQYVSKGEKAFNMAQYGAQRGRRSICINNQNMNGYTFGQFPCPLPAVTGMNQMDRFCCGPINAQFCCNEREFNSYQRNAYGGGQRHGKNAYYPPSSNRAVAIIVPIVGTLAVALAAVILFLYFKNLRKDQPKSSKSTGSIRLTENYSAVPRDPQEPSNTNA